MHKRKHQAQQDHFQYLSLIPLLLSFPLEDTMSIAVTENVEVPKENEDPSRKRKTAGSGYYDMPWVEKYRPRVLGDVVGNEETLVRLQAIAEDGNMPNLILCGPPGTGKTTSVHALARQLLGEKAYATGVLELNASDARGIDVSRRRFVVVILTDILSLPMID